MADFITVTATIERADAEPRVRYVIFTPTHIVYDSVGNVIYTTEPIKVPVQEDGSLGITGDGVDLVATNSTGIDPPSFQYKVRLDYTHPLRDPREWFIEIDKDEPGGTVDLADLAPASFVDQSFTYVLRTEYQQLLDDMGETILPDTTGVGNDYELVVDDEEILTTKWRPGRDHVDVRDRGFVGDGSPTDLARWIAACADAIAVGADLYIPKGTWLLNFTQASPKTPITGSLRVRGAGRGQTILTVGPNQPNFAGTGLTALHAFHLFHMDSVPPLFEVCDITINGPADPTRGGTDWHDRNYATCVIWNQQTGAAADDAGKIIVRNAEIGGNFKEAFMLSNGDVDVDLIDVKATAYEQIMTHFDSGGSIAPNPLYTDATWGPFMESKRWLRLLGSCEFYDTGIPPWTAGEDGGGVADASGSGHMFYCHPNVNVVVDDGVWFHGGVAGKYCVAVHTGSVTAVPRQAYIGAALFEGPSYGLETGEGAPTRCEGTKFRGPVGVAIQGPFQATGCTFDDAAITTIGSRRVPKVGFHSCHFRVRSWREQRNGTATASSTTFTQSKGQVQFSANDVGRTIAIFGAGTAGAIHQTTIAAYTDAQTITLTSAPATTVSGTARYMVGATQITSNLVTIGLIDSQWRFDDCDFEIDDDKASLSAIIGQAGVNDAAAGAFSNCRVLIGRREITDAAITSGTAVLTTASATFNPFDVGKNVIVTGAGAASADLITTISAYTSSTQVTLAANASTTVSGVTACVPMPPGHVISWNKGQLAIDNLRTRGSINASRAFVRVNTANVTGVDIDGLSVRSAQRGLPLIVEATVGADLVRGHRIRPGRSGPSFTTNAQRCVGGIGLDPTTRASTADLKLLWNYDAATVSGTANVNNIFLGGSSPDGSAATTRGFCGSITLVPTGAFVLKHGTGNISVSSGADLAATVGKPILLQFDPTAALWRVAA